MRYKINEYLRNNKDLKGIVNKKSGRIFIKNATCSLTVISAKENNLFSPAC
jgi:hypothetical protein